MTQISGKKYQMKNAAGTENRFPYTVMEAVLGLNSYLQDQFSALADIYMPIEGITESKTGQEFVYRKSPATIKAKSLTLDRIYGNTLAWNQLIDGNVTLSGLVNGVTRTKVGNHFHLNGTAQDTNYGPVFNWTEIKGIVGHKYLYLFYAKGTGADHLKYADQYQNTGAKVGSFILTANSVTLIAQSYLETAISYDCDVYANIVDLTLMFGAGNEPATVEEFESMFPKAYYPYNAGTLISNDAESIETVGFNLLVSEPQNIVAGSFPAFDKNIYTRVFGGVQYYFRHDALGVANWRHEYKIYDLDGNEITSNAFSVAPAGTPFYNGSVWVDGGNFTVSELTITFAKDCYVYFGYGVGAVTAQTEIKNACLNLSDPAKNGTYEPYRKTTLQLGLNNFKVKDGNGNITTITGGLKSAGSVRDEIVGNKYIKRIGEVDLGTINWQYVNDFFISPVNSILPKPERTNGNGICTIYNVVSLAALTKAMDKTIGLSDFNYIRDSSYTDATTFKTAMSGVMLYYELATPIEYELVEPLVYSMAAGTTEARVSPNADGLSAPFCCDMTYDADANNDSANAQYAATAGRLYNTHKLWGQDFDGSNDVSGALSGVTTIEASGNITTVAQLISTVATGTAPLSVASTTEVANLHSYTATKLHTQRTLWGQNFDGSGNVTGDMSSVGNIAFSASGKNIASLLYFDTTNSRVGVGASSPAYKLDVNGTLNASGNTTLRGTLDVRENTTIGGTFTVGTSSVNKATTLYGALTASGAVSFSDTLTIAGLTTFNGNAILPANKIFTIGPASGTHATLEWDATNSCVKITGNLRVTGWIEQQGTQS